MHRASQPLEGERATGIEGDNGVWGKGKGREGEGGKEEEHGESEGKEEEEEDRRMELIKGGIICL